MVLALTYQSKSIADPGCKPIPGLNSPNAHCERHSEGVCTRENGCDWHPEIAKHCAPFLEKCLSEGDDSVPGEKVCPPECRK